ncbi:MAG: AMP-binding protein [Gammaproteobacteria bacterium]|nr:AMP-binding protein [Gammaproteobacteria bacterium]
MNIILNSLKQFSQRTPDTIAIEGDDLHLSYSTLQSEVVKLSGCIKLRGYKRLAIMLDNGPAWVVFDLAAQLANITLIPLPAFFTPEQIRHSLADAAIEVLITDQTALTSQLLPEFKARPMQKVAGKSCWQIALPVTRSDIPVLNNIAKITYTSGTTGTPKGVCLTQAAMNNVACSLKQTIGITAQDRHLCLLPLAVLLENIAGIYTPLLAGARCIIPSLRNTGISGATQLNPQLMANAIRSAEASSIILLPQMLQALIEDSNAATSLPENLRFIAVGGAPVSRGLLSQAQALNLPVYEGYGLSECASVVAVNTPNQHRIGSVGKVLPHTQIKFAEGGEILLANNLFNGYLNNRTLATDEWHASGDLGYLDKDGYLYLTGRKKSCFITSFGRNVAPEWVEKELTLHPAISQAVVFGEAQPCNTAIIVANPNTERDKLKIIAAIEAANRHLPDYAQVSRWLYADAPFSIANQQLTATGRIRRNAIWSHYGERIDQIDNQYESTIDLKANKRSQHAIL